MSTPSTACNWFAACLAVVLSLGAITDARAQETADPAAAPIAEQAIAALQAELTQHAKESSASRKRRGYKNTVRDGAELIASSPLAPNRFRVLALMLQSQKQLLLMENTDEHRAKLYEICTQLAEAPDRDAEIRLDADLLLSDRDLTAANADLTERARALAAVIERYRDTPAEAKSLKIASRLAPKLEADELQKQIIARMADRYADDPAMIEFRVKQLGLTRIDVLFAGTFERADGVSLNFPADTMGHTCLMVFWSQHDAGFEDKLKHLQAQTDLYPGLFKVFSFNTDGLTDAGENALRGLGLDWSAMRLPGGKNSQTYRTYAHEGPFGLVVNAYGRALLTTSLAKYGKGHNAEIMDRIDTRIVGHDRFLSQLQSLLIGDFLVFETDADTKREVTAGCVPAQTFDAIRSCFTKVPMRYRLTGEQTLADYTKAERLCREAIAQHPDAPDLWRVRNRRIIALLGMWNLATEPKHLDAAADEAHAVLALSLPTGDNTVAQFCLAKAALREGASDAADVLSGMIDALGGPDASATAHAAAVVLSLDANNRDQHAQYRQLLLDTPNDNPALWPVIAFLRDRYHIYHLFRANDARTERIRARGHLINHGGAATHTPLPPIELKTLDGKPLKLPATRDGKMTLLIFVEPPADPDAEIPIEITGMPAEEKKRAVQGMLQFASEIADLHLYNEVNVVAAFITDDAERIQALAEKHQWNAQIALVPGGLDNPMVRRLGIVSADRLANVFLIRRDGTIAWQTGGLKFKAAFSHLFSVYLGMMVQIEICEIARAYQAYEQGDFKQAVRLFAGPFPKKRDERYGWTAPRFHARALSHLALQDWDKALADIDTAIAAHDEENNHDITHPCDNMILLQDTRATILDKLGETEQAEAARRIAAHPLSSDPDSIYTRFHMQLKQIQKEREQHAE